MLEGECRRNIELMWLLERLCPDHNTIAIFRAVNRKALVKVFKMFVRLSVELGLCSGNRICVDGTTIKAVNGMDAATSMDLSQKKLEYAQRELEQVEKYLSGMDAQDQSDQGSLNRPFALDIDPLQLPDPEELKRRIAFHEACIQEMETQGETQLTFTDPDARMMPSKRGGLKVCYNIREERVLNLPYIPETITDEKRASGKPEDIRACLHAGVLPDCYRQTNLRVELQRQTVESCFIRHEDGTVTCPMGKPMLYQRTRKNRIVYGGKEACRCCPNRCTEGKSFKTVKFGPHTTYVPVRMYGSLRYPLQQIPDVRQPDHYHAYGRVRHAPAKVIVFIRRDKALQKERMQTSEHPFGTIKHYDGASYFLCRGKEKAAAETALMYLSYNIRRAIHLAGGVQRLIARCRIFFSSGIPMPI